MTHRHIRKWSNFPVRILVTAVLFLLGIMLIIQGRDVLYGKGWSAVYQVKIPLCDCYRDTSLSREERNQLRNSSCPISTLRGTGQRVLSYSFYDDPHTSDKLNRNFFRGIQENLNGIKDLYNEGNLHRETFSMRLYFQLHSTSKNLNKLCELVCSEPLLDICQIPSSNKLFPMLWRFFPIGDQEVDLFFSRDLDSRITPREIHAVNEFFDSNKSIHVMRDHKQHGIEILGGMWGARLDRAPQDRQSISDALRQMLKDPIAFKPRTEAQHDQMLLRKYMWPLVSRMGLCHDSYHCHSYGAAVPFPSKRPESVLNFVGAVADVNNTIAFTPDNECPIACRPQNHKDWAFC